MSVEKKQDNPVITTINSWIAGWLMPRNSGCIGILSVDDPGFLVGLHTMPFLLIQLEADSVTLSAAYPPSIAVWGGSSWVHQQFHKEWWAIERLPKHVRQRSLMVKRLTNHKINHPSTVKFEYLLPDSLRRLEYYTQTIITKIKRLSATKLEPRDEFTDLIAAATSGYRQTFHK